ncbi:MAG: glycosyltransferase [Alphaproteobacteria bacterium]|nr:glycosyltransferase [Alphaproteobacteria bacterium]
MDTNSGTPVILQIIPELGAGGAEQGCIDVAAAIIDAKAKAIVVSSGGYRVSELARIGATHIDMPVHSKNPFVMWQNIGRIRRIIKKYNVSIVHVRSRAPAWSAWRAVKDTKAHFVTTCHAPYNISGKAKHFYNSSIAKGEIVIAVSDYVAQYLKQNYDINPDRVRTIHRGIPIDRFHPTAVNPERMINVAKEWRIEDGANIVMMPGRLTRWKGHHVLIEAMAKLRRDDVFCVMIGSDQGREEYRKELEKTIEEYGLGAQMRIVDQCLDMPAAYMLSTVVVSASTDPEGFGRVPVEAQAMGRPIIASDHGGAQETIARGETGWHIPVGDSSALATAIQEALSLDAHQRAVLATRSMAHVAAHFTKEMMTDKTLGIYAELLQKSFAVPRKTDPYRSKEKILDAAE